MLKTQLHTAVFVSGGAFIEHNSMSTVSKNHLYLIKLDSWYKEDIPENMFPAN